MHLRVLIVVFTAAGTIAEATDTGSITSRLSTGVEVDAVRSQRRAAPVLVTRSGSSFRIPQRRRTGLQQLEDNGLSTTLSKRDDDDDDDEDDDDDDGDDEHDEHKAKKKPVYTGAIVGGVLGGVIPLTLIFLLYWFKFRPRRQNRRRKRNNRDEETEEERKKREEQEQQNSNTTNYYPIQTQQPYQPVPAEEPPNYYQQGFAPSSAGVVGLGVSGVAAANAAGHAREAVSPTSPPLHSSAASLRRGTMEFPAELPSPIDGREPSFLPTPEQRAEYQADTKTSSSSQHEEQQQQQEQQPGPVYIHSSAHPADLPNPNY